MAAIIPVIMGGRVLQLAAPRALALIEAGVARYLPSMRTVGSQSAAPSAAGSYFRSGASNLPAMADRPGLIGKGLAGGAAAGSLAMGGPEPTVPPEGRVPIPPGLFGELDMRGARAAEPPPPPVSTDMSARFLDGPSTYDPATTSVGQDVFGPPQYASTDMSARFLDPGQTERRAVQVARDVVRPAAPAPERAAGPSARELFSRYNESESPADFIIASNALLRERPDMIERYGRAEGGGIPEGMMGARPMPMPNLDLPLMDGPAPMGDMPPLGAMGPAPNKPAGAGAGAGGRDAAINKALEIIHHLVIRGR